MHQAFGSRSRKPKFQLTLRIIDLNNVPLVSGSSYIKWDLPSSSSPEHRGRTAKCPIREHSVTYNYSKSLSVRLNVDKSNHLEESVLHLEVLQEYSSSARGERIVLGNVKLNLAEYVDASEERTDRDGGVMRKRQSSEQSQNQSQETGGGEEGVVRRYLMRDSKINSTLKVGIHMRLLEGDRTFIAPTLKTAPVFGGIAGIMAGGEQQNQQDSEGNGDATALPIFSLPQARTREATRAEARDLYRRNLAAHFNAQPGELRADECIEDIFAGGDGWGKGGRDGGTTHAEDGGQGHRDTSGGGGVFGGPRKSGRDWTRARKGSVELNLRSLKPLTPVGGKSFGSGRGDATSGSGSASDVEVKGGAIKEKNGKRPPMVEVDEFEVREHLRGWVLPGENKVATTA